MEKKTIGIIGGMGPLATSDLFRKIVVNTKADSDNAHPHIVIDNNTNIPDRTKAIIGRGQSPLAELIKSTNVLKNAGADFLIMPCNTAHYFHAELSRNTTLPVLNMLELTADRLVGDNVKRVGLLATDGTIATGIYDHLFEMRNIDVLKPGEDGQREVMSMIYDGIKAGKPFDTHGVRVCVDSMLAAGAEILVLGCTELPLAFEEYMLDYPTIDPTLVLALNAIKYAGYDVR